MSEPYRLYIKIVDALRARRAKPDWVAEDDRANLALLEDLFGELTPEEQQQANEEGWRSWPDLYDAYMEEHLVEQRGLRVDGEAPVRLAA